MNRNSKIFLFLVAGIVLLSYPIGFSLIDVTPINAGKGWDGNGYFMICELWARGESGGGPIPYQLTKMGAFAHILVSLLIIDDPGFAFKTARIISPLLTGSALFMVGLTAVRLDLIQSRIHVATGTLLFGAALFSHSWFTMPIFYPILTDHAAIFIASMSLLIWSSRSRIFKLISLPFVAAISCFIMPAICLVPITLLLIPCDVYKFGSHQDSFSEPVKTSIIPGFAIYCISCVLAVCLCIYLAYLAISLPLSTVETRVSDVSAINTELKGYSIAISYLLVSLTIAPFVGFSLVALPRLSWKIILLALIGPAIGIVVIYSWGNFIRGFGGPPLLENLLIQSMRAPGASLAAIFAALGPIPILCISGLSIRFYSRQSIGAPLPFVLLVSFFSAFLLWGNESRQFVAIVPVMLFFCLYICRENLYASIITLIAAIATLPIGHPIADSMRVAIATGVDFSKPTWQSYFGRQGPWMSDNSIALYLGIVCVFTLLVSSTLQKNAGKASL